MTDGDAVPVKHDDHGLLTRRLALEARGVVFRLEPHTFPLRWRARWPGHEQGPLPMHELVPLVEELMPPVKDQS